MRDERTAEMMEYQPWQVVEGIDGALICVMYVVCRKSKRREKGSRKNKRNRDNCGSATEILRTQNRDDQTASVVQVRNEHRNFSRSKRNTRAGVGIVPGCLERISARLENILGTHWV